MAISITFDTLEYVNKLKAADVPQKQAEAQAQALQSVLDTTLAEQARQQEQSHTRALGNLDTKTERAIAELSSKTERSIAELSSKTERSIAELSSKTERSIAELSSKTERSIAELKLEVKSDIALVRKDMEAMENRMVTRLTKVMITVVGITVGIIGCIAGVARLLLS